MTDIIPDPPSPPARYSSHAQKASAVIEALLQPEALAALLLRAHDAGLLVASHDDLGRPWFTVATGPVTYAVDLEKHRDRRATQIPHTPPQEPTP